MQHTFFQKALMVVFAGAAAAGLLWLYQHVVERSRYELNEGWRDTFKPTPAPRR
jgi:hypothetical protein